MFEGLIYRDVGSLREQVRNETIDKCEQLLQSKINEIEGLKNAKAKINYGNNIPTQEVNLYDEITIDKILSILKGESKCLKR